MRGCGRSGEHRHGFWCAHGRRLIFV